MNTQLFFCRWVSLFGIGLVLVLSGCHSVPITGRNRVLLVPESREVSLGLSSFQEVLSKEPASTNRQYVEMVKRVGDRIAAVSGRPDYQWEFRVIASQQQNAFCLPGGKVAVYEGILPICESESGLAVVMSHEIGHALARHGGERMTEGYAVEAGRQVTALVTQRYYQQQHEMVQRVYGVGTQYGVTLPFSRTHELEADYIGLLLMARAGYDPTEAPRFWNRFASAHTTAQPYEFMSTHPSDAHRSQKLADALPEAIKLYEAAPSKFGRGEMLAFAPRSSAPPPSQTPTQINNPTTPANFTTRQNLPLTNGTTGGWTPKR